MGEKVAIVGSRAERDADGHLTEASWARRAAVFAYVAALAEKDRTIVIVSGGADGVDNWAADAACKYGLTIHIKRPDWDKHGRRAGMMRNAEIISSCDRLVAFWDGASKGTADSIEKARKANKPVEIIT